jgi:hypothetical protein
MLRFDAQPGVVPSSPAERGFSAGADLLLGKKPDEGVR